jgi:hypothetical protein
MYYKEIFFVWYFCVSFYYLCVYHLLPILLSYDEMLFCGFLGLKLLLTATCLTLGDYFVVLYGSAIL